MRIFLITLLMFSLGTMAIAQEPEPTPEPESTPEPEQTPEPESTPEPEDGYIATPLKVECDVDVIIKNQQQVLLDVDSFDDLIAARNTFDSAISTCMALSFSGNGESAAIGPVDIPPGLYRTTFTTAHYGIVTLTPFTGNCATVIPSYSSIFNVAEGEATNGAELFFESEGCTALIQIDNVRSSWVLKFAFIQ